MYFIRDPESKVIGREAAKEFIKTWGSFPLFVARWGGWNGRAVTASVKLIK